MFDPSSYQFSAYAIPLLLFGTLHGTLGLVTLRRERASTISITFCAMTMSTAVWLLSFAAIYSTPERSVAIAWIRIEQLGLVFIPSMVFLFSAAVTGKLRSYRALAWAGVLLSAALYVLDVSTGAIVRDVHHYYWGYYPISGMWSPLLLAFFGVFLGASLHLYRISYRATQSGAQRQRLMALMIALGIADLATVDFLPTFHVAVYPLGYVFIGTFTVIAASAIWRYRLVDITPALAARSIVDTMSEGLLVLDRDGVIRVANAAAAAMFGGPGRSLVGTPCAEIDDAWFRGGLSGLLDPDQADQLELPYRRNDKLPGTAIVSSSKLHLGTDDWVGTVCIIRDITERKIAEETLRESEAVYRALVETSPDAVILTELDGRILMANGRTAELVGLPAPEDLRGRNAIEFFAQDDRARFTESFQEAVGSAVIRDVEYTLVRDDGATLPVELSVSRIPDAHGAFKAVMAVVRDITVRQQAEEEIRYLAFHDALTGAANRSVVIDRLDQALAQARRERGAVGVIFVDLDEFKEVNDSQGHAAGDALLKQTADELRSLLREGDTLARVGGDEFVVLLPGIRDPNETVFVAERVTQWFRQRPRADGERARVSASLGIATYPLDGDDAETLLRHADAAMYWVKNRGGNDYQLFASLPPAPPADTVEASATPEPSRNQDDEPQRRAG